jgi:hypothetical protein
MPRRDRDRLRIDSLKLRCDPRTAVLSLGEQVRVESQERQYIFTCDETGRFLGVISAGAAGVLAGGLPELFATGAGAGIHVSIGWGSIC